MRTEQQTKCFVPLQKLRAWLVPLNMLKRPSNNFISDRSKAVVLLWFSVACFWCQSFGDVSPYVCSNYFLIWFRLLSGNLLGNSCSLG